MQNKIRVVFLIFGLVSLALSACPSQRHISNFEAGSITFDIISRAPQNQLTNSIYRYSPKTKFSSKPFVALGIQEYQINDGSLDSFAVQIVSADVNLIQVRFKHKQGIWKKLRVNLWISAHPDIILGTLSTKFNNLEGSSAKAIVGFSNSIPNYQTAISRAMINGLTLGSHSKMAINVESKQIRQKQLEIEITVGNGMSLKEIHLSYLIFSPSKASFDSYGGVVSKKDLNGEVAVSVHRILGVLAYPIYGIVNWVSKSGAMHFSSEINQDFIFTEKSSSLIEQIDVSYIILGISSKNACSFCSLANIENSYDCVESCPSDRYKFIYKNGGTSCQKCSPILNMEINQQRNGCQCKSGYRMIDGKCEIQNNGPSVTVISQSQNNHNSVSVSSQQTQLSISQPVITTISQPNPNLTPADCSSILNAYWAGYKCVCKVGFKSSNGVCAPLDQFYLTSGSQLNQIPWFVFNVVQSTLPPTVINPATVTPIYSQPTVTPIFTPTDPLIYPTTVPPIYPQNYYPTPPPTFHPAAPPIAPPTYPYPPQSTHTQPHKPHKPHEHITPQKPVENITPVQSQCEQNEVFNPNTKKCNCVAGMGKLHYVCQICPAQYTLQSGICVKCPQNAVFDNTTKACKCKDTFSSIISPTDGQLSCVCSNVTELVKGQCKTKCPANQIRNQAGNCVPGCSGKYQIIVNLVCTCEPGFERLNGTCVAVCAANEIRNSAGICQLVCPAKQSAVNGVCVCISGYKRVNGVCVLDCPNGQHLVNGACISCPGNATFFPFFKACFCNQGFSMVASSCVPDPAPCPLGQRYNDNLSSCVPCDSGCNQCLKNNICVACPVGFNPFQTFCLPICGNGIISGSETCDDGNTKDNDGCSSNCVIEPSYECTGAPSVCTFLFCGDNKISASIGETCDDGDANSGDGCSSTCQVQPGFCCIGFPSFCYPSTSPCPGSSSMPPITQASNKNTTTSTSSGTPSPATTAPTAIPTPTPVTAPTIQIPAVPNGLEQDGVVSANSGNVFIKLKTLDQYTFASASQIQNFFSVSYPQSGTTADSKSCTQNTNDKRKFTCMLMYNGGVPSVSSYPVDFSFTKNGKSGNVTVTVKPLETTFALRSLH